MSIFLQEECKYHGCLRHNATSNAVGCYSCGNQPCSCKCYFFWFKETVSCLSQSVLINKRRVLS